MLCHRAHQLLLGALVRPHDPCGVFSIHKVQVKLGDEILSVVHLVIVQDALDVFEVYDVGRVVLYADLVHKPIDSGYLALIRLLLRLDGLLVDLDGLEHELVAVFEQLLDLRLVPVHHLLIFFLLPLRQLLLHLLLRHTVRLALSFI